MRWMFLPLKRYTRFEGRSRRKEFWFFALFVTLVLLVIVASVLGYVTVAETWGQPAADWPLMGPGEGWLMLMLALVFLFGFLVMTPTLALLVRRLHDINRSGWWVVGPIAVLLASPGTGTVVDLIWSLASSAVLLTLIVFCCRRGTIGPNRYGPDPESSSL